MARFGRMGPGTGWAVDFSLRPRPLTCVSIGPGDSHPAAESHANALCEADFNGLERNLRCEHGALRQLERHIQLRSLNPCIDWHEQGRELRSRVRPNPHL
jgi:hypothetical protein